jgi:carbamoyl-phosphate synthase large subunit
MRRVGVETGGSNVQFAVNPETARSSSSSSTPGSPQLGAGQQGDGLPDRQDRGPARGGPDARRDHRTTSPGTPACFEPDLDYVIVKIPAGTSRSSGAPTAPRHRDAVGRRGDGHRAHLPGGPAQGDREPRGRVPRGRGLDRRGAPRAPGHPTPDRLAAVFEAFRRGMDVSDIHAASRRSTAGSSRSSRHREVEQTLAGRFLSTPSPEELRRAKRMGFARRPPRPHPRHARTHSPPARAATGSARSSSASTPAPPSSRAHTPYLYSTYEKTRTRPATRPRPRGHPRQRAQPHRPGPRVRLLLLPRRLHRPEAGLKA